MSAPIHNVCEQSTNTLNIAIKNKIIKETHKTISANSRARSCSPALTLKLNTTTIQNEHTTVEKKNIEQTQKIQVGMDRYLTVLKRGRSPKSPRQQKLQETAQPIK